MNGKIRKCSMSVVSISLLLLTNSLDSDDSFEDYIENPQRSPSGRKVANDDIV